MKSTFFEIFLSELFKREVYISFTHHNRCTDRLKQSSRPYNILLKSLHTQTLPKFIPLQTELLPPQKKNTKISEAKSSKSIRDRTRETEKSNHQNKSLLLSRKQSIFKTSEETESTVRQTQRGKCGHRPGLLPHGDGPCIILCRHKRCVCAEPVVFSLTLYNKICTGRQIFLFQHPVNHVGYILKIRFSFCCRWLFLVSENSASRFDEPLNPCAFFFFFLPFLRSAHAKQFHSFGRDQSTVGLRPETTVDERSLMSCV